MKLKMLLRKGYFPKELPPPFTTKYFANNYSKIDKSWNDVKSELNRTKPEIYKEKYKEKYKSSKCVTYSIPKRILSRRNVEIPNPFHHSMLCKTICDKWNEIDNFYQKSVISLSKPIISEKSGRAAIPLKTFDGFKQECLIDSFDKMYELKTDISWFYPTIYTHTIPWALHGKKNAKNDSSDKLFGNTLDKNIRNCKHGQTTGIPIGPDTSLIIAEIVSCAIDDLLKEELESLGISFKGFRYYDDIYFYFSDRGEAETGMKIIQHILRDFQLSINEEKTDIKKFISTFDRIWVLQVGSFEFRENINKSDFARATEQKTDIEKYFKLIFYLSNKYPEDAVLSYAIHKIISVPIMERNWKLFESLILKATLLDPILLKYIVPVLLTYNRLADKNKIGSLVEEILKIHAPMGHSHEVSWALWLAKTFNISIEKSTAEDIFKSSDVIPIIMALDLKNINLIDSSLNLSAIIENITENSLFEEKWILTYESIIHEWLPPINPNPLETNEYFKILKDNDVKFYDEGVKAKPRTVKGLEVKYPVKVPTIETPSEEGYPREDSIKGELLEVKCPVEDYSDEDDSYYY